MKYRVTIVAEFDSREPIEKVAEAVKFTVDKSRKLEKKLFEIEEIGYKKITAEDLLK